MYMSQLHSTGYLAAQLKTAADLKQVSGRARKRFYAPLRTEF